MSHSQKETKFLERFEPGLDGSTDFLAFLGSQMAQMPSAILYSALGNPKHGFPGWISVSFWLLLIAKLRAHGIFVNRNNNA